MATETFSNEDLKNLLAQGAEASENPTEAARQSPFISIYMPTNAGTTDAQQNPVRLRQLIQQVEEQLTALGYEATHHQELLQPIRDLLDEPNFTNEQEQGLAIFRSPDFFQTFREPVSFEEKAVVSHRFQLKPLLPVLTDNSRFFILVLSQQQVKMFRATHHDIRQVYLPQSVPLSLAETLQYDDIEKTDMRIKPGKGAQGQVLPGASQAFASHGNNEIDHKTDIRRFFQQIDKGLHEMLRLSHAPLVLAGVEYLHPIYKEVNSYGHLLDEGITGNHDITPQEELHARALPLVEPVLRKQQDDFMALYEQNINTERFQHLASADVKEVVRAAFDGRVAQLFVADGDSQWGTFDPGSRKVNLHPEMRPGDEDLYDLAATQTLANGGDVFVLPSDQMPDDNSVAALFRY